MRVLTGITPSGKLHIGNYFGAMRPAIELQDGAAAFYFIAEYHSLTAITDPVARRHYSREIALDWLACGLDPERCAFFRQSDVPEVCELMWLIGSLTPMGLLERAHGYKDKTAKGLAMNFGLFAYPVLMAADILAFETNLVPVGRDQKQHLEIARDIAIKFNQTYGDTFVVPEPLIRDAVAVVPGLDGQKMSKSYGNTIDLFGEEKAMRKRVMSIVMDSRPPAEPKPDADQNIAIQLLRLMASAELAGGCERRLREGGLGYGELKQILFEQYWAYFAPYRARRAELAADLAAVDRILDEGGARAREIAKQTVLRARTACGLGFARHHSNGARPSEPPAG